MRTFLIVVTTALALGAGSRAEAVQLVTNGGFETGTLAGWTTSGLGSGSCPSAPQDWNVSSSSNTGCSGVSNPNSGTYAAYVMNDGPGPLTYQLFQTISDPASIMGGTLSFEWTSANTSDAGRTLTVSLAGTTVFNRSTYGDFDWSTVTTDISALLAAHAGTSITLEIDNYIPQTWSGAAGLGLDDVSIVATVPEPATFALLGAAVTGLGLARRRKMTQGTV
jgi:PEP-CTERM motif